MRGKEGHLFGDPRKIDSLHSEWWPEVTLRPKATYTENGRLITICPAAYAYGYTPQNNVRPKR